MDMMSNVRLLKEKIALNPNFKMVTIARGRSMDMMSNVRLLNEKIAHNPNLKIITFARKFHAAPYSESDSRPSETEWRVPFRRKGT